ncbi:nuclear transport factor 2 family protein [Aquiflexum gelatinilyticum]|uniref:DUF3828 domain-containing protein n=1 Tax=Aquiflexum gelatinilyticum TaxID=2961943 RepID=A0A9X2P538_9BACT|nr:nuclear transport factor 2 family protein [Aquiflexum gelatinilyticum]MCR9015502.1 DUF3828 domain-containing protein [Aquiflexum gelatinilyticum]
MNFKFPYFILVCSIYILMGCGNNQEAEIKNVVEGFYSGYDGNFRTADTVMISKELQNLISKAIEKEIYEAKKMKESDFPTDKPMMIEGDVFTSLYEGHNSASIEEISMEGQVAHVKIIFQNTAYNHIWSDQIILIKENNTWKIDNVVYEGQQQDFPDLQSNLKRLIDYKSDN